MDMHHIVSSKCTTKCCEKGRAYRCKSLLLNGRNNLLTDAIIFNCFVKRVICTIHGLDWAREKWKFGVGSKFIRQGEKNAVKYADEIIVLSKGVQKYFMETYGRETHFIPNGVNRPEVREAKLITDHFGLEKDSYILFLGRLVPEKGIRYLVEAFKNVKTDIESPSPAPDDRGTVCRNPFPVQYDP